jgi:capsular exopolysaccharide synthesis family protein
VNDLQPYPNNDIRGRTGQEPYYGGPPHGARSGKEQLEEVIDFLYKGKWTIVLVFTIVFSGFAAYTYVQEPEYGASSLVMISSANTTSSGSANSSDPTRFASPDMQWGRSPSTELTLLQNSVELPRSVAEHLMNLQGDNSAGLDALLTTPEGDSLSHEQLARRIRAAMSFGLTSDGLIRFRAVTTSPQASQLLADLYVREYIALTRSVSRASLVASREFLSNQLQKHEEDLQNVEQKIQNYLRDQGTASIASEESRLTGQVSQMQSRRDELEIELERRKATLQALQANLSDIQPQLAQNMASTMTQDIELVQQKIAELKATRQEAMVRNPEWERPEERPELAEVNRQIQRLQEEVDRLSRDYVNQVVSAEGSSADASESGGLQRAVAMKQQIASEQVAITGLEAELEALDQQVQAYRSELLDIPGESIQIQRLQRERERTEETYNYISQRLQEVRIREEGELGYASIISQASLGQSVQPQPHRTLILGAFFGLMMGTGLALLRYKFDNRLFKPDDIEERGYNVTIVPDMQPLLKSEHQGEALVKRNGRKVATSLVTLHNATSHVTEAYRQLRTNVQYNLTGAASNVVLVTSAGVGEGKSTTAANLAVAFARAGSKTLLIDADMRRPQMHNFFGLSLEPGFYQLLQGGRSFAMGSMDVGIDHLSVLTAGQASGKDAAELIQSDAMQELLNSARERFDMIIVDTPPVLAVTEAKILAPKANASLVVTRAGETKEKELDYAVRELQRVGGQVLGVVLNKFNLSDAYGYKYRYRDYSSQGHYASYAQE